MLETLRTLISIPSYSGQELKVQQYIKEQLESSKIDSFFQGDNLIVHLQGKDQTRAFVFNGHVDVVDIGEIKDWKYNPWEGTVVDGRIYGRGASDMKGGIWAMMETAKSLAQKGNLLTDVWFAFVVREETDGQGTKQFVEWFKEEGYLDRYHEMAAIFAEPTNFDTVKYGHRGNFFIKAEKIGVTGHSARPGAITPHAILEMIGFINDLIKENLRWQKQFKRSEFAPPTIIPTSIQAISESPNKTAVSCQANFDLRTIPGFHQEAFDKVRDLADRREIKLSLLYPSAPAGYTKPNAKIITVFQKVIPEIKLVVNDASNDLGVFTDIGIDGVMFGPGEMSEAHSIDEFANVDKIISAPDIFEKIYLTWAKD